MSERVTHCNSQFDYDDDADDDDDNSDTDDDAVDDDNRDDDDDDDDEDEDKDKEDKNRHVWHISPSILEEPSASTCDTFRIPFWRRPHRRGELITSRRAFFLCTSFGQ